MAPPDDLIPSHPRLRLATLPTPLERARGLEEALRHDAPAVPRIYLKRDDLLSLGMGGNKIRNLEFSIAQALDQGATDVVTAGRQQSNHCRLAAAACARAGLRAHLVFTGARPGVLTGNLLLDDLLGASMRFTGSDDRTARSNLLNDVAREISARGGTPFVIPVGGSDAHGALGQVLAAAEVVEQMRAAGEPRFDVVLATATGGTQAGLLAGFRKLGEAVGLRGFAVAHPAEELAPTVLRLANEVAREIAIAEFVAADVVVDGSMLGGGYGAPTPEAEDASTLLARSEGIFVDPVYTAKGLAGLVRDLRAGRYVGADAIVFIHTGGLPALFAR
jgi:1-aminocyclopropane-1-carboxylate deaminase/D-cysteine desulfhydrase-like pyridoxal-dependent ACC family enzyme